MANYNCFGFGFVRRRRVSPPDMEMSLPKFTIGDTIRAEGAGLESKGLSGPVPQCASDGAITADGAITEFETNGVITEEGDVTQITTDGPSQRTVPSSASQQAATTSQETTPPPSFYEVTDKLKAVNDIGEVIRDFSQWLTAEKVDQLKAVNDVGKFIRDFSQWLTAEKGQEQEQELSVGAAEAVNHNKSTENLTGINLFKNVVMIQITILAGLFSGIANIHLIKKHWWIVFIVSASVTCGKLIHVANEMKTTLRRSRNLDGRSKNLKVILYLQAEWASVGQIVFYLLLSAAVLYGCYVIPREG